MGSALDRLWERVKLTLLCRKPRPELRTVHVNHLNFDRLGPKGEPTTGQSEHYPDNTVCTAQYNLITFLPRNLLEQLLRLPNFYFLVACVIQLLTDTPVSELASILPLTFVILITTVKQGYEELLRHLEDRKLNKTLVWSVRDGESKLVTSESLRIGDLVKVFRNESFPCDLLLLSSSLPSGECLVTTTDLDGETNLKTFWAVGATKRLRNATLLHNDLRGKLLCEQPTPDLYSFAGTLHLVKPQSPPVPLNASNLLLRGAVLRNTSFIYGLAVYTGSETKVGLNSQGSRSKRSVVDIRLTHFLLVLIAMLLIFTVVAVVGSILISRTSPIANAWFLPSDELQRFNFQDSLNALIIMHYIIPISLLVSIEVQKFFCSMFIDHDLEMFHRAQDEVLGSWAKTNTSDIIEELGVVDHLFCDKTGTLTENIMTFRACSIGGIKLSLKGHSLVAVQSGKLQLGAPQLEFLTHLALCHTARAERTGEGKFVYHASSPDEKALLDSCRRLGVIFRGKTDSQAVVSVNGRSMEYQVMQVLEFDSHRRRMSILVTDPLGVVWLITKGADSAVLPRCISGNREATAQHVDDFSAEGLRVLVVARKRLSQSEAQHLVGRMQAAAATVTNREKRLAEVMEAAEDGLQVLGCTAVEDELQSGVPETIRDLRLAGLRVWVLTGDKVETAENISLSAGHVTNAMRRVRLVGCQSREQVEACLTAAEADAAAGGNYCLVLDGDSLQLLTDWAEDRELCRRFLAVADGTAAVLCCRCTPLQKSRTVAAVKAAGAQRQLVTCAIGDGANDVSMIKEAHVGVGLYGKEGRAAALNADYCLARFKYLRKLLLFHGHLFYYRMSMLVQYFFYKNIVFTLPLLYYTFHTGFSMISLYDSFFLATYNACLTAMPVLVFGIFEQHLPRSRLYREPRLYAAGKASRPLSWGNFFAWLATAFWHSGVCFYGNALAFMVNNDLGQPGVTGFGRTALGTLVLECLLLVVHIKLALCAKFFHMLAIFGFLLSLLCYPVMVTFYNCMYTDIFEENFAFYWMFFELHQQPAVWLLLVTVPTLALAPDLAICIWRRDPLDAGTSHVDAGEEGGAAAAVNDNSTDDDNTASLGTSATSGGAGGSAIGGTGSTVRSSLRGSNGSSLGNTNGSILRSTNGSTLRSTNGSTLRSTNGSTLRNTNGSTLRSTNSSTLRSTNGSTLRSTNGSTDHRRRAGGTSGGSSANASGGVGSRRFSDLTINVNVSDTRTRLSAVHKAV